ncbi:V-set and immunoglobulin domain-containing protein 2-like isoform X2 [Branchiostoma floridae x Branchiostoma japonicum]
MLLQVCLAAILAVTVSAVDVSKQQGQSHVFECDYPISADRYVITWMKDDEAVMNYLSGDESPAFSGDLVGRADVQFVSNRNLEIMNLRVSDEGEYYCSVNELGAGAQSGDGSRYQLVVFVPPTISLTGGPYEVEIGETMMATCRANSHPPSNFTWTLPNGDVSQGAVLEIANMTQAAIGRYMCFADNGYGTDYKFVDISMTVPSVGGSDVMHATGLPIMLLLIASLLLPVVIS